jgi:hypothetical protein
MDYTRQLDIFNPEEFKDLTIGVIGAGSVGSFIVLTLAKMGFVNITVWDDDTVEEHNLPNQFYPLDTIGLAKVMALRKIIKDITGVEIIANNCRFNSETASKVDILISAVDSIEARREIWKIIKDYRLYIDTRMGRELIRIFTVRGQEDYSRYERTMEREGFRLPCTARTIIYNVLANASLTALIIRKFLKGEKVGKEIVFNMQNMLMMNITK